MRTIILVTCLFLLGIDHAVRPVHEQTHNGAGGPDQMRTDNHSLVELGTLGDQTNPAIGNPGDGGQNMAMGGLAVACDDVHDSSTAFLACTVDEFVELSTTAAAEVECKLAKVQNVLDLVDAEMVNADKKQRVREFSFNDTKPCPNTCPQCLGQRYYTMADERPFLLIPQPRKTGRNYAYAAKDDHPQVLKSIDEITFIDEQKINEAIQFATSLDDSLNAKFLFKDDSAFRILYRGHDPAVIFDLASQNNPFLGNASKMCMGGPNKNLIDESNYNSFFFDPVPPPAHIPDYWGNVRIFHGKLKTVVTRTVWKDNIPMGTATVHAGIHGLTSGSYSSMDASSYMIVITRSGHFVDMTQSARDTLFTPGMTMTEVFNPKNMTMCLQGMSAEELKKCDWLLEPPLTIYDAAKKDGFSGIDFSEVVALMFKDPSGAPNSTCADGLNLYDLPDHANNHTHVLTYCNFQAVPDWGIIFGRREDLILSAARAEVSTDNIKGPSIERFKTELDEKFEHEEKFVLRNTGKETFPFLVREDRDWMTVNPKRGTVEPGEEQTFHVKLEYQSLYPSRYQGAITIGTDREARRAACWTKPPLILNVAFTISTKRTDLEKFLKKYKYEMFYFCVAVILLVSAKLLHLLVNDYFSKLAKEAAKMEAALNSVAVIAHPMVLLAASAFKSMGKLVSHEEGELKNLLTWKYSVDEVVEFCTTKHIVFVSHQWTAFGEPDPDNIQYDAMVIAINALQNEKSWKEEDMYMWVDYTSIPQVHRGCQTLAINSLTGYASNVAAFVVVAPKVIHKDLGEECNKDTYQKRAWCRAEQLSHYLAKGSDQMFLAEGEKLSPLTNEWLEQSVDVFRGELTCCRRKHEGMDQCDKQKLVVPMLGLWAHLCIECETAGPGEECLEVKARLNPRRHDLFPATFEYETPAGVQKGELFGQLIEKLPDELKKYHEQKAEQARK